MNRRTNFIVALVSLAGVFLLGCADNPVGRKCDLGVEDPNPNETVLASPSLDCQSRLCLKVPQTRAQLPEGSSYPTGKIGLCTASCESDDDCDRVPESPCKTGFTCAVATVVGPFCCEKMCICKDYIVIPDGGVPLPEACVEGEPANSCCNLPGRAGNPDYPNCP